MHYITASWDTLVRQAGITASEYFNAAVRNIDETFYSGYAEAHPELVAALVKAAAKDFETTSNYVASQERDKTLMALGEVAIDIAKKIVEAMAEVVLERD